MSFNLRLIFSGLCVYVFDHTNNPANSAVNTKTPSMDVLLVDARAPGDATSGEHHISHIPSIQFEQRYLTLNGSLIKPSGFVQYMHYRPDTPPQCMWILNGNDIEIKDLLPNNATGSDVTIIRGDLTGSFSSIQEETETIHSSLPVSVKQGVLTKSIYELTDSVVARLKLKGGEIGCTFADIPEVDMKEDEVYFETTIQSDRLEIVSKDETLKLFPKPGQLIKDGKLANMGQLITIKIQNMPPPELIIDANKFEFDFDLVYRVLDVKKEKQGRPKSQSSSGGAPGTKCRGVTAKPTLPE